MNNSKCRFYEEDIKARIEAEEVEKAYIDQSPKCFRIIKVDFD